MERRNLIYTIILAILSIAVIVVVILILHKRADDSAVPLVAKSSLQTTSTGIGGGVKYGAFPVARPLKAGDKVIIPPAQIR